MILPRNKSITRTFGGGDDDFIQVQAPLGASLLVHMIETFGCAGSGYTIDSFDSNDFPSGTQPVFASCYRERFPATGPPLSPGAHVLRLTSPDPPRSFEFAYTQCGDGVVEAPFKTCDDGNTNNGDGCSSSCTQDPGFLCTGAPSTCAPVVCTFFELTSQPPSTFLPATGLFTPDGYVPNSLTNTLTTEDLTFPYSIEVDVEFLSPERAFVGTRSSGLAFSLLMSLRSRSFCA